MFRRRMNTRPHDAVLSGPAWSVTGFRLPVMSEMRLRVYVRVLVRRFVCLALCRCRRVRAQKNSSKARSHGVLPGGIVKLLVRCVEEP